MPEPDPAILEKEERKEVAVLHSKIQHAAVWDLIERYSRLPKLLRVTAVCKRAVQRFKGLIQAPTSQRCTGTISTLELDDAQSFWVRTTQHAYFYDAIQQIASGTTLPRNHQLARLAPIVDPSGVLRIGGRLAHSQLTFEEKHPIILPQKCKLATLVIEHHHRSTLHGGTQLTLTAIRQRFWILGGRVPVRTTIHRCVICARQRAAVNIQQMGQLPPSRVIPSRPFLHTGVDYAGPFTIKAFRGRTQRTYKGYILIFVCFTVSAVHLELVSDYSSAGFIAAYKRFVVRRGICATLNSDCGRNFVGANAELRRLLSASTKESTELADTLASLGTQWRFNPPSAPHFGGKWEAGVKSVKYHLKRVVDAALLTYEEFSTLLTQIEAVLNSRPLWVLSDDPSNDLVITPGQFLTGAALNTIPEPSLTHLPVHRLFHWQRTRRMLEHFWSRWGKEYLQSLLNCTKWHQRSENIKIGSIVLIKGDNLPPSIWPLGRVVVTHPGTDGLIRVVTVQTKTSRFKRPITKVCLLPVLADE